MPEEETSLTGEATNPSVYMEAEGDQTEEKTAEETEDAEDKGGETNEEETAEETEETDDWDDQPKESSVEPVDLASLYAEDAEALAGLSESTRNDLSKRLGYNRLAEGLWNELTGDNGDSAFVELANQLGKSHLIANGTPKGASAKAAAADSDVQDFSDWYAKGYGSEHEYRLDVKSQRLEKRLQDIEAKEQKRESERAMLKKLDESHDAIASECAKRNKGFRPTKEQVKIAMEAFPSLTPIQAVESRWHQTIMRHADKNFKPDNTPKGHPMPKGGTAKGNSRQLTGKPSDASIYYD